MKISKNDNKQVSQVIELLTELFNNNFISAYIYGSAVDGGLKEYSDLDILVIIDRDTTTNEKTVLIKNLLKISGKYMQDVSKRPLEITILNLNNIIKWTYPPQFDFQYGEWLRTRFVNGDIEPWESKTNPDLAILLTQALNSSIVLYGQPLRKLIDPIPSQDFIKACTDELDSLLNDLLTDTRNVLLTLVRIWYSVRNVKITSKDKAVNWAIAVGRIPKEYEPLLLHAKNVYLNTELENWEPYKDKIFPCANYINEKIISVR